MPTMKKDFDSMFWIHEEGTEEWVVRREHDKDNTTMAWLGPSKGHFTLVQTTESLMQGRQLSIWKSAQVSMLHISIAGDAS